MMTSLMIGQSFAEHRRRRRDDRRGGLVVRGSTLGGRNALWPFVSYGTSGGAPPFGQSLSLPGESGRGIDVM